VAAFARAPIRWTGSKEPLFTPNLSSYTTMASLIRGGRPFHDQFVEEFYWYLLHSTATHAFPEGIFFGRRFAWSDTIPHATGAPTSLFLLRHALLHERGDELHLLLGAPDWWLGHGQGNPYRKCPNLLRANEPPDSRTATGVANRARPARRQPPPTHCPASAPIPFRCSKAPKGVNVVYRPTKPAAWIRHRNSRPYSKLPASATSSQQSNNPTNPTSVRG